MFIWWTPKLIQFHNNAYNERFDGGKTPGILGSSGIDRFPEALMALRPSIEAAMIGKPIGCQGSQFPSSSGIVLDETEQWTCDLTLIDDEAALHGIGGILAIFQTMPKQRLPRHVPDIERHDERQRHLLLETAVDFAIIATNCDGTITEWNAGAETIFDWAAEEMLGRPADRCFTQEDRAAGWAANEMREALETGRASSERWQVKKDGSYFWASGLMMPLRREDGTQLGFIKIVRNKTDQRQILEVQRADAELLRRVLDASRDTIEVLDRDGGILLMNGPDERITEPGNTAAPNSRLWFEFLRPEGHGAAQAAFAIAKGGGVGQFQSAAATAAGKTRWLDVQVTPILGANGQTEKILSVSRDITELRQAACHRAAVLELGELLRDLSDPAEMGFVAAALIGRTLEVTGAGYGTVNTVRETVSIERDWTAPGARSIVGIHRFRHYGSYIDGLKRGEPLLFSDARTDPRMTGSGNALIKIDARSGINLPIFEHGVFVAIVFLRNDTVREWSPEEVIFIQTITDRTRSAGIRELAKQRVHNLMASLEREVEARTLERDRIWQASRDMLGVASLTGIWTSINPAWKVTLGWNEEDIIGKSFDWLTHPDDTETLIVAGQNTPRFENRLRTTAGDYRWLAWTSVLFEDSIYCVARDVTVDKQQADALAVSEAQLHQAQKMEAVGQLTGGLAHDFNNILATITGSLEMLRIRVEQGRTADLKRYIMVAQNASTRAASLTHRLLAYSRQQAFDPRPTSLNRIIAGMDELVRRTVGPSITVEVIAQPESWNAFVDPHQLENALLNLCINARDALPDGGWLTIETTNRTLDDLAAHEAQVLSGDYAVLCVSDDGVGMPPDVKARAFDPFFTTKPVGKGTGLGLSMIYGFARQAGGQVHIRSEAGRGTAVSILLPRHAGKDERADQSTGPGTICRAEQGETVLVVEDEPIVRMLIVEVLEDLGYNAIEVADGPAGLKVLRSDSRVDLLIADIGLPGGMNGRQVADAGRLLRPDLKVLFITGYAETVLVSQGRLDPGMQVLVKPFATEALASRIREMIGIA